MVKISSTKGRFRNNISNRIQAFKIGWGIIIVILFGILIHVGQQLSNESTRMIAPLTQTNLSILSASSTSSAFVLPTGGSVITIGYAISITSCTNDYFLEGAAVLQHSIYLSSIRNNGKSKYDYQLYAIYHPDAESCVADLADLGYTLLKRKTPVDVNEIQGDFLRERIVKNGCCGEKELIKLEAYTLVQHPIVIHLDMDCLILKPLDVIIDAMLADGDDHETRSKVELMWPDRPMPKKIIAMFTRDMSLVWPELEHKPIQGGFLMIRPDMDVYQEFVDIVKEGNFIEGKGWGGVSSVYYGAMTIQGIIPYYYSFLHPPNEEIGAVDLNRCLYNAMCDNPRRKPTIGNVTSGKCMTGEETCEDCRKRPLEQIYSTHFTVCQKPWICHHPTENILKYMLCRVLIHEWFRIRSDLEKNVWNRTGHGTGTWNRGQFYGYCHGPDLNGYERIQRPYSKVTVRKSM